MFTGIVTDVGAVADVTRGPRDARFRIATALDLSEVAIGASIACAGVCLTAVAIDPTQGWFEVEVSNETLSKTNLGAWERGRRINLEGSLKVGDELGGHIVSGHVDGVADVVSVKPDGASIAVVFAAPRALAPYLAAKGSVALDGCSLTVNTVRDADDAVEFSVYLIPHTQGATSFAELAPGVRLNIEVDMLARYVARIAEVNARSDRS